MYDVKGAAVRNEISFLKETFGRVGFAGWGESLSVQAGKTVDGPVLRTDWYENEYAGREMPQEICELFFDSEPCSEFVVTRR